jgi:signal transduction histidine kinase
VLREALTNTARHAHASRVDVEVTASPELLTVEIADDGVGLRGVERRSGLANLQGRAERHGGEFTVLDQPGTGLRWTARLT